jgi:hypothetical protein
MPIQKLFPGLLSKKHDNIFNYLRFKDSNKLIHRTDAEKMIRRKLEFDKTNSYRKSLPRRDIEKKKFGVWEIF